MIALQHVRCDGGNAGRFPGSTQPCLTNLGTGSARISYEGRAFDRCRSELHESLRIARDLEDNLGVVYALQRASELLHALELPAPAVQLRAAVVALREQMGARAQPHAQREEAKFLDQVHEVLDDEQFARAWAAGSRMSLQEAANFGLERLDER